MKVSNVFAFSYNFYRTVSSWKAENLKCIWNSKTTFRFVGSINCFLRWRFKKNLLYFRLVSGYICIKVNKLQSTVGYDLSAVSDISAS